MTTKEGIIKVLEEISPDLSGLEDDVFIIGATAMILSGVSIGNTPDIDVLTSSRDADVLNEKWKTREIESYAPADGHLFRSAFTRYNWGGMDVEVMGNLEVRVNNTWQSLVIQDYVLFETINGSVRLPTLKEQMRILKLFGREKDRQRIALIQEMTAS